MKPNIQWTIAVIGVFAAMVPAHAQGQNGPQAEHGNQKNATVICDVHSLQDAVDRAAEGATITVQGTCTGGIVIRKDRLRIVGESGATIQVPADVVGILILGNGVEIRDLNIVGGRVGIDLFSAASAEISASNILQYTQAGIEVRANSNATIVESYISSPGGAFAGINLLAGASAQLINTVIDHPGGLGLAIAATSSAFLAGNQVLLPGGSSAAILVTRTAQVAFSPEPGSENTISNPGAAALVCSQTSSIFVGRNQIIDGAVFFSGTGNCEVVAIGGATLP
ncbi:MAG: right-handed parallel beta-helix repeat-containing protein [Woeseiaceae bacterium]|nr:right-handed parallel beta-helix repeat-containing protein [Woeseiaceae bacterium]